MIYKRVRVVNQYIAAGQIVGAPVAPLSITGSSTLDTSETRVVFEDVLAYQSNDGKVVHLAQRDYPLIPAAQRPMRFDVSAEVYIELKGHFHFPPLVMYEGIGIPDFGGEVYYTAFMQREESVAIGTSATQAPVTLGKHYAYMLLSPAKFTGEVIFHNTVGDRTEPFQFPLRAHHEAKVAIPMAPYQYGGDEWLATTAPLMTARDVDRAVGAVREFVNAYPSALRSKWNKSFGMPTQVWDRERDIPAIPLEASGVTSLVGVLRPEDCQVVPALVDGKDVMVRYLPWSKEGAWVNMFAGSAGGAISAEFDYYQIYQLIGAKFGFGLVLLFKTEGKLPLRFALPLSYEYFTYITGKLGMSQGPFNFADDSEFGIAVVENHTNSPTFNLPAQVVHRPALGWENVAFVTATTLEYLRGSVGVRTLMGADMFSPSPLMLEIINSSI